MEYLNTKILNYRLTRFIGEGGMASVYEGTHEKLGTKVAIKILNPVLTANKQIRQRFENEAKMMASLNHPNIIKVLDYDELPDKLAIVMELLEGHDLKSFILKKGVLKPEQVIPFFVKILDAFQYAHSKGIIHRDIKPSNIFIDEDNQIKVLDFGIAKIFGAGDDFTSTGAQLGTPTYMSPEQVKAEKNIDQRTDIYSLGVTLFFLLNGKPPYDSSTQSNFEIFNKIVYEPIPDLKGYPEINAIIKTAVAKDRNQRFPDARAFKQALLNPAPKKATVVEDKTRVDEPKVEKPKTKTAPEDDDKTWIDSPGAKPPKFSNRQDDETLIDKPGKPEKAIEENKKQSFEEQLKKADLLFKNRQFGKAKNVYENALLLIKDDKHSKVQIEICKTELVKKNRKIGIFTFIGVLAIAIGYFVNYQISKPADELVYQAEENVDQQTAISIYDYAMVYVPGGTFQMGSNDGEDDEEKPVHNVTLDGFYIGKYEVTQAQWREIMGDNPSYFINCDNCPVEKVSWNDVQEFIKKLNQKIGKNYRLPTEAEWEYAARGGSESGVERSRNADFKYSGSNNIDEVAWHGSNSGNKTYPVGQKKPNSLGIYDMTGNVWEWCSDWYRNYHSDNQTNPQGPSTGSYRVRRGGSWGNNPQSCRMANRNNDAPNYSSNVLGFRLSRMP